MYCYVRNALSRVRWVCLVRIVLCVSLVLLSRWYCDYSTLLPKKMLLVLFMKRTPSIQP
jgi:hypothetical protein